MIALRKIRNTKGWDRILSRTPIPSNPPIEILSEFVPPSEDRDRLSVYVVDDDSQAVIVAAALAMLVGSDPSRTIFARADTTALAAVGLRLIKTPGETAVSIVDALHHDLVLPDRDTLNAAAANFINTDYEIIEASEVRQGFAALNQQGEYDLRGLAGAKVGSPTRRIWESVLAMIAKGQVAVTLA